MKRALAFFLICLSSLVLASNRDEVSSQRARGCVNSTIGICQVPILALFSPYAEQLYGTKVVVKGYVKQIGELWVLFPDKGSADHVISESALLLSSKDGGHFDSISTNMYIQAVGVLQPPSEAIFWAEIALAVPLQELPFYVDGTIEPAPPIPGAQR